MKKVLAILLALAMLLACSCGPSGQPAKDDRTDAIKPASGEETVTLYDSTLDQTFTLTRVTTESREDAADMLDVIYAYLESLGITAKIKSMYTVPFGLAGQYADNIPVKVYFTDENVAPIYVMVLKDTIEYTKGLSTMGSFRDADITNNEYFNKCIAVMDAYNAKLKEALGFAKDDVELYFPVFMTRDLSFAIPSESQKDLYGETNTRYFSYILGSWHNDLGEPQYIGSNYYQPLNRDDIKSRDDLGKYLAGVFTQDRVTEIRAARPDLESGDYPVYYEKDGKLWVAPIGMGGPEDLESIEVKYAAEKNGYLFFVVEATRVTDRNWDTWEPLSKEYQEFLCVYEKSGDSWLCDYYTDISFGWYQTML